MIYYLKDTGKEVGIGDTVSVKTTVNTIFGPATAVAHVTINQDNIKKLLEHDVIRIKDYALTIQTCCAIIAEQWCVPEEHICGLIERLKEAGVFAPVLQMLLKAASDYLTPNIEEVKALPRVFTISMIDGKIYGVNTEDIKTYDYFAYFVSKTHAKQVKHLLKDLFREMYGE